MRRLANPKLTVTSVQLLALGALSLVSSSCVTRTTTTSALGMPTVTAKAVKPAKTAVASTVERHVVNATELGDGDLELKMLRERVTASPADLAARLALAKHYKEKGFPEIAEEHLRLACERAPESVEAHLELAKHLRKQENNVGAVAVLAGFAERNSVAVAGSVDVWAWLGLMQDETADWKSGELSHRKAVALAPKRDDLHNNLGYCLLQQGRREEAIVEFQEALRINKNSAIARDNLGIALAPNPKEAVLHLQSVSDPASAHSNLAAVLIEAGKYAEARKEIDTALGYNRQHRAALENLLLLSQLDGKPAAFKPVRPTGRWVKIGAKLRWILLGTPDKKTETLDSGKVVASR